MAELVYDWSLLDLNMNKKRYTNIQKMLIITYCYGTSLLELNERVLAPGLVAKEHVWQLFNGQCF